MVSLVTALLLLMTLAGAPASADEEVVTGDVNADIDALISNVLPRAKQHIRKHGGFLPFGGALMTDGQVARVTGKKPETAEDVDKVTLQIASSLRRLAVSGDARAVGLAVLVHTAPPGQVEKTDAIWIRVEHVSGFSKSIFLPYEILDGGRLKFGTPFSVRESREFFHSE
jgi:hypothetical protein